MPHLKREGREIWNLLVQLDPHSSSHSMAIIDIGLLIALTKVLWTIRSLM